MHFTQFQLVLIVCTSTLVQSLPISLVADSNLLTSGQAAQALNAQFQTLTTSSPCGNLTTACIDNSIATCKGDTWTTSNACAKSQSCFAIPNVKNGGTTLTCTSEKNALSIIGATGATGGITGTDSTGSSTTGGTNSKTSAHPTATATATGSDSQNRVTVTVTLTKPASATRTISPQEASSIISSLLEDGQATTISQHSDAESTSCSKMKHAKTMSATTAPPPTPTETTDNLVTGSTISLVAATETGSAPSSATPTLTAATTAVSNSSSGDGYGGY